MSAIEATLNASDVRRQSHALGAVGVLGVCVDACVTYALVRAHAVDPIFARFPAYAVATVVTFAVSRWLNVKGAGASLRHFLRSSAVFAVGWTAYTVSLWAALDPLGLPVRAEALPVFVAFGAAVAAGVTSVGSKLLTLRT